MKWLKKLFRGRVDQEELHEKIYREFEDDEEAV